MLISDELRVDSPDDPRENIKCKFLVEMPDDFYQFWDFAKSLTTKCPSGLPVYYSSTASGIFYLILSV